MSNHTSRGATGRPRGTGVPFVRVVQPAGGGAWRLYLSRSLWHSVGEPTRLTLHGLGNRVELRPAASAGYAVTKGAPVPTLTVPAEALAAAQLALPGRYAARVVDGGDRGAADGVSRRGAS